MEDLKNSGHLPVQEVFEVTQTFVPLQKCSKFISSCKKVTGRSNDQRFIVNFIVMSRHVTSCHVMLYHATSCHVMSRHAMSRHAMSRHARHVTSCHVMSRHVMSCHIMSRHVTSCHVMPRHTMSRHVTSCHVMSHRKSRDGHTTRPTLYCQLTFFHTLLIQIRHIRVGWLSRRVQNCRYHTASAVYNLVRNASPEIWSLLPLTYIFQTLLC